VYQGLAGFFIVSDEEEDALELPDGDDEILFLLQDRTPDAPGGPFRYQPNGMDIMEGLLGTTVFVNGVPSATQDTAATVCRLRILNGSNARVYRLALTDGSPLVLIGNDGGLLPAPQAVSHVDVAPAERVDILVDFTRKIPGDRIMLQSLAFNIPGLMSMRAMGRGRGRGGAPALPQGAAMDVLELVVTRRSLRSVRIPSRLPAIASRPSPAAVARRRTFRFGGMMMDHTINRRTFDMARVDERVPLGQVERWTFVNEDQLAHPVHVHATSFEVEQRRGGRAAVMPWERGLKDTVLILPGEQVDVLLRFEANPGLFLLHCHNLEHEDAGMMLNFAVES
jgi:FtsP/CotA-like multicopper oxidase with cupredoxin domain